MNKKGEKYILYDIVNLTRLSPDMLDKLAND